MRELSGYYQRLFDQAVAYGYPYRLYRPMGTVAERFVEMLLKSQESGEVIPHPAHIGGRNCLDIDMLFCGGISGRDLIYIEVMYANPTTDIMGTLRMKLRKYDTVDKYIVAVVYEVGTRVERAMEEISSSIFFGEYIKLLGDVLISRVRNEWKLRGPLELSHTDSVWMIPLPPPEMSIGTSIDIPIKIIASVNSRGYAESILRGRLESVEGPKEKIYYRRMVPGLWLP